MATPSTPTIAADGAELGLEERWTELRDAIGRADVADPDAAPSLAALTDGAR